MLFLEQDQDITLTVAREIKVTMLSAARLSQLEVLMELRFTIIYFCVASVCSFLEICFTLSFVPCHLSLSNQYMYDIPIVWATKVLMDN